MNDIRKIEKSRKVSDGRLISEGAILQGDHLLMTYRQIEDARAEMVESMDYRASVEQAKGVIEKMDDETFTRFANELQYAMKYYDVGKTVATSSVRGNDGGQLNDEVMDAYLNYGDKRDEVTESPLHEAVRSGLKTRWDANVKPDWAGWLGFESKTETDKIVKAIEVKMRARMPIRGTVGKGFSPEDVANANQVIEDHGIKQVFILEPEKGLLANFHEHFGSKLSA